MKKFAIAFALVLSSFAISAIAGEWTGWISDSKCGAKGAKAEHQNCAEQCIKGGAAPVFVSDGKVLKIDDASKVQEYIGQKVTVSGELKEGSLSVDSVKPAE